MENIFFPINFLFNFYNKSVEVYKIGYQILTVNMKLEEPVN